LGDEAANRLRCVVGWTSVRLFVTTHVSCVEREAMMDRRLCRKAVNVPGYINNVMVLGSNAKEEQ
jgi:hypothetical protein